MLNSEAIIAMYEKRMNCTKHPALMSVGQKREAEGTRSFDVKTNIE